MKKLAPIIPIILLGLLLQDCHHEHPTPPGGGTTPDSLYQSTPYQLPYSTMGPIFPHPPAKLADSLTVEGIQLGRMLFYDNHLSVYGDKSCASCHKIQYGFSDAGNALSTNEFGLTKRNAPSLQNLAYQTSFFWDGRQPTLQAQANDAFHNELGLNATNAVSYLQSDSTYTRLFRHAFGRPGTITINEVYTAIAEFEISAVSYNSPFDQILRGQIPWPNATDSLGFYAVFLTERGDCFHCHFSGANALMTDGSFRNDGLQGTNFTDIGREDTTHNPLDEGLFKVPTLINISVSGPYMHDGRYKTLAQVVDFYSDSLLMGPNVDPFIKRHMDTTSTGAYIGTGGMHLTAQEKTELLGFLSLLTDSIYLNNPNLKSPF